MGEHTYFKLGGSAQVFCELKRESVLIAVVAYCSSHQIPSVLLGGGSNCIVPDEGIAGLVIAVKNDTFELVDQGENAEDSQKMLVEVGAGLRTALLVSKTVDHGLTGLEFFLGVPGSVGGAVFNNAHYLTDLVSEHIESVVVLSPAGDVRRLAVSECDFGYDTSRFQTSGEVILRARFLLARGDRESSQAKIKQATLYRAQTQPLGLPSSGCIFQNVANTDSLRALFPQFAEKALVPGGFLIDQAGLKLAREGDIEVSQKHAAFFVNRGKGTAAQVVTLIQRVKRVVREKFGVELKEEVFWLQPK